MHASYDAIIIGAGQNGLVCACYLARAGRRVLVLERRHLVGGACVTEEIFPGFKVSTAAYVNSLFRKEIIADLRHTPLQMTLRDHGSFEVRKFTWKDSARKCIGAYERAIESHARRRAG